MHNRRIILGAALAALTLPWGAAVAQPGPPPPPQYEARPPYPPGHYHWHWVGGRWRWNGHRGVWIPGHWRH